MSIYVTPFMVDYPDLKSMEIMCVGDFHLGDRFSSEKILDDIKTWVKAKKNRFITIDGDIFNAATKDSVSDVYSETHTIDECMELFGNFIDDIGAEKILCCINGNHDERVWKSVGIDPVKYVCHTHGVRYSPGEAFVTVKLGHQPSNKNKRIMYRLYVTHGCGGGRTDGAIVNALKRLSEIVEADVYIQGHVHKPFSIPNTILKWSSQGNAIVQQIRYFVISGACLTRGGYAVSKAYPPVCTWSPVVKLSGEKKHIETTI